MKKFWGLMLSVIFLVGCSSTKTVDSAINDIEEPVVSDELEINAYSNTGDIDTTGEVLENATDEQDIIAYGSQVGILNFLQNGTFWATETNKFTCKSREKEI